MGVDQTGTIVVAYHTFQGTGKNSVTISSVDLPSRESLAKPAREGRRLTTAHDC